MQARDSKGRFTSTKKGRTMSKTYTYKNQLELIQAISGNELYGLSPTGIYNANKFNYPIKVTVDEKKKTFSVTESKKKDTQDDIVYQSVSKDEKTPFYKKGWFWFAVAAAVIVVAAIVVYNVK